MIFICKYEKDEKLAKLAPLMAKFEKVTLNGSQKMTAVGWEEVRYDPSYDVFSFTLIILSVFWNVLFVLSIFVEFHFRSTICGSMATNPSSVKLRKLELKITRNDDDVIRFRREIFLEELKGIKLVNHCVHDDYCNW